MDIIVEIDGKRHPAKLPVEGAPHVEVAICCPHCAASAPLKVSGKGQRVEDRETYVADAYATCCMTRIGVVRAVMSTIFGLEEDEAVLLGRCRVY